MRDLPRRRVYIVDESPRLGKAMKLSGLSRRALAVGGLRMAVAGALATFPGCTAAASEHELLVWRDAGCGCCHGWVERMRQSGQFRATMTDEADMPALKRRLGVPDDLVACHTALAEGFVIEGHVPAADIERLLSERPAGIRGLAVPGMPVGSPGMEARDGTADVFDVVAFGDNGTRRVFARHT